MTGGYKLIIPLMIVTALSYFISRYFHQESIYTAALVKSGIKFRSEKEKHYIRQISVRNIIETDFIILHPQITLREIMQNIIHSKRNLFPVVDDNDKLLGVITLDNIREIMLNTDVYDVILAYEVMNTDFHTIDINEDINHALEEFEENNVWNLAVTENGQYKGFISKSNIFNKYLSSWATQYSEEF
jgi:CIC family chloride channel protein